MDKETFIREYKGVAVAGVAVIIVAIVLLMNLIFSTKQIVFRDPVKPISINAGQPYTISWGARNVGRIGIALFRGNEPKYWIVENYPASAGKFLWTTFIYEDPGADYRLAIAEYPWKKGNAIAYSPYQIEIVGRRYASCDDYSVVQEWPFLADNYSDARQIFVTQGSWTGNLGGIAGADEKCKQEAQKNNYKGNFIAFLGTDEIPATERIKKDGIFIEADAIGALKEGRTCHRFVASSLKELLDKTRPDAGQKQFVLSETLARRLGDVWYGRRTASTESKCLGLPMQGRNYAFSNTYSCQGWTIEKRQVYSGTIPSEADLPSCFTVEGKVVKANNFGAASSSTDSNGAIYLTSDTCDQAHRLVCVEQ